MAVPHEWRTAWFTHREHAKEGSSCETQGAPDALDASSGWAARAARARGVARRSVRSEATAVGGYEPGLFGQLLGGSGGGRTLGQQIQWIPALEIEECDGKLVVQADRPGFSTAGQLRAHRAIIVSNFIAKGA